MISLDSLPIPPAWGPEARPRMAEILAHPRFDEASQRYIWGMRGAHENDPMVNHLMSEVGRFTIVSLALYLHAGRDPRDPRSGLSLTRLQDLVGGLRLASRGRVEAVVRELIAAGFVTAETSSADARLKLLMPTAKLERASYAWQMPHLEAVDMITRHEGGYARHFAPGNDFYQALQWVSNGRFLRGIYLAEPFPQLMPFVIRDCGYVILLHLLTAPAADKKSNFGRVISLPFTEMVERRAISRSHIRRLLIEAEEHGILRLEAQGGQAIAIAPEFDALFRLWLAATFWCFEVDAAKALVFLDERARMVNKTHPKMVKQTVFGPAS